MNATEKDHLSVDGIFEVLHPCANNYQLCMVAAQTIPLLKVAGSCRRSSPSPNRGLPYETRARHQTDSASKDSSLSQKSMDIIKTARDRWTRQEKKLVARSLSIGSQQVSSEPLAALGPHGQADLTKPRNCRRIVVLGASKVGKTNIIRRFLGEEFEEHYEPTVEDFHRKLYHIRGEAYQVDVLDAAGERDYPAKRRLSILTGDIFLLVFSVNDRGSFSEVCELLKEIKVAKTKLMKAKDAEATPIIICGNKVDLEAEREVSRTDMSETLGENASLFETSAKHGTGLKAMFDALVKRGGLPNETNPYLHQTVSIHHYQAVCDVQRDRRASRAVGLDTAVAAVLPRARRPSFHSDLQQVLGKSTKGSKSEKCQIQ